MRQADIPHIRKNHTVCDRIFDANGNIEKYLPQILLEYQLHGYLHIVNSGITSKERLLALMPSLGFTKERNYVLGGRASSTTQDKWVVPNALRVLDYYPPQHYLLPNTEVQYLKAQPQDILFFVEKAPSPGTGGRIFAHSIKLMEELIAKSPGGEKLLLLIREHGLKITTGYIDKNHPQSSSNYMKSWQELSGETVLEKAIAKLSSEFLAYDRVWVDYHDGYPTIMTEITNPGFSRFDGEDYLTVPRIAMTPPCIENGFRTFTLGNGCPFSEDQISILLDSFVASRQGSTMHDGDIFILNNSQYAHSREPFSEPNQRSVLVGMAGVKLVNLSASQTASLLDQGVISASQMKRVDTPEMDLPKGLIGNIRYQTPTVDTQIAEEFSALVFDLDGRDLADPEVLADICQEYEKHGRLHITGNTKYIDKLPDSVIESLGFGPGKQFPWGGVGSGRTIRTAKGQGFHTVDKYPAELTLLPHQEIFYQRIMPVSMMFSYRKVSGKGNGGRTPVHSGELLEKYLSKKGPEGQALIEKLRWYGQTIITGFLDANHSLKEKNFVRSWQDRFQTNDIEEAISRCLAQKTHFDDCWAEETGEFYENGAPKYMLMTEITVPLFKDLDGSSYMMFPRIAYDQPSIINGLRKFIVGNGEEFSPGEISLLLEGFWATREGRYQAPGDIILVNNIKFGHSREPYIENKGEREAVVVMAGEFETDPLPSESEKEAA